MLFQKQFVQTKVNGLEEYCGLLSNLEHTALTYAIRPLPFVGKIDLASVFFNREKLQQEKLSFSEEYLQTICVASVV